MRRQLGGASKSLVRQVTCSPWSFRSLPHISQRRCVSITTTPSGAFPQLDQLPTNVSSSGVEGPDAKFEVLGAPFSLLSASLSASQTLYTRRGTLVGLSGKAENAVSSLSTLEPLRRAALGIPFFYQKITSASPITALISTKSPITSFAVVHLDGTIDWMVTQRRALLAWTGQTLSISPTFNRHLTVAHWGDSQVTGRGLLALVGKGQVYQVTLKVGEQYTAHPSNVVAYTVTKNPPQPYRFKSSVLRFESPGLGGIARLLPESKFFRNMKDTATWKGFTNFFYALRTWSRRTIFGDSLFLQFQGPTTLLLQTRASRVGDVLTAREVNEIADTPAGAISSAIATDTRLAREAAAPVVAPQPTTTSMSYASVGGDGKVNFEGGKGH